MTWRWLLSESIASIRFYQRRTTVTVLSLAWGVASFVLLVSYGNGFGAALLKGFQAVGQDLIIMAEGQTSAQAGGMRSGRVIKLDRGDVETIREAVPGVAALSPEMVKNNMVVVRGTREKRYSLRGVNAEYQYIRNMTIVSGRWIGPEDVLQRNRVAVLGATTAKEMFSGIPPVGEDITIQGQRFTVIGVLEAKGQMASYNKPDNLCVFVPYDTMGLYRDIQHPDLIVWMPVSPQARERAIRDVRSTLAAVHHFSPNDEKAVFILAFNQFMHLIDAMTLAAKLLLGFVGALTLGIGGVGLANVMLASVLDRTREIGALKAFGGPRNTILKQFLIEALLIVGAGGLLGVVVGAAATYAVGTMPLFGALMEDAPDQGNVELGLSVGSILVSVGVLLFVGLVAGMIPAIKAARLNPIEALRYE
ncbi:MAG: ABC transporter permease [Bryobacteraceae bacterium]